MSQSDQNFQNHTRFHPIFHFLLLPASLLVLIGAIWHIYRVPTGLSFLIAAGFSILPLLVFQTRGYALKVQDRVIRLEERLRLSALCSESMRSRIAQLTEGQLIALRFASDGEAPALAAKALDENLTPKQIKAAIQNWRGDYFRV